jgi:hypothetical protein
MKKWITLSLLIAVLTACGGESAAELKVKCYQMLDHPLMKYYKKDYVDAWRKDLEGCKNDPDCIKIAHAQIRSKFVTAQVASNK